MTFKVVGFISVLVLLTAGLLIFSGSDYSKAKSGTSETVKETVSEKTAEDLPASNNAQSADRKPNKDAVRKTVVVELFTSEGCSSCPPADYVLNRLDESQPVQDVEIITLGQHVDYWDRLGWKDTFSAALFTERQNQYAQAFNSDQVYTPQMVVDGKTEFVGSNMQKAQAAIIAAANSAKAKIELSVVKAESKTGSDNLTVKISELPKHTENVEIFLAITEDNLVSKVSRGENSGKNLAHRSVVRDINAATTLTPDQDSFNGQIPVRLQSDWKRKDLHLVVFAQETTSRKILGAARVALP